MKKNIYATVVAMSLLLGAFDVAFYSTAYAGGDSYQPRIVGMGRAFTAVSRGLGSVGLNPANLALNDRNATITIDIIPTGFSLGSDLFNYQIYNDFFTGVPIPNSKERASKVLTDKDKQDILGLFPGGIARTQMKFEQSPIGISIQAGDFGFALTPFTQMAMNMDLSEGYFKFLLDGFPAEGRTYTFDNTAVNASLVAGVNFSAAYLLPYRFGKIDEISVGIGVKYLVGLGYIVTDRYKGSIGNEVYTSTLPTGDVIIDSMALKGNVDFLQYVSRVDEKNLEPAGTGMGFDFGVSALVADFLQVGISVTDIGKISWNKKTQVVSGNAAFRLTDIGKGNDSLITNAFKGETKDTTGFDYDLPTAIHIGTAVQLDDVFDVIPFRLLVAVDGHFGLNEVAGNTKIPQFGIGFEFDPLAGWLPLRTGFLLGGRERFAWSAGMGIHIFNTLDIDFATQSMSVLTNPNSFRTASFTFGLRLRI